LLVGQILAQGGFVAKNPSVLISGIGIAGPTLAYWLEKNGFEATLVEHAPSPREGGYVIDFWGIGYDVVDRMSILPDLKALGYRIEGVRASGRRTVRIFLHSANAIRFVHSQPNYQGIFNPFCRTVGDGKDGGRLDWFTDLFRLPLTRFYLPTFLV
jgi:hypothetical protein